MSSLPISRFPVPDLKDLPEDIRTRILMVQEKAGFVPNVFLALAHRPAEWRSEIFGTLSERQIVRKRPYFGCWVFFARSAAKCEAVEALPPLPTNSTVASWERA